VTPNHPDPRPEIDSNDLAAVTERLRSSKLEAQKSQRQAGIESGNGFASLEASYEMLQRLARCERSGGLGELLALGRCEGPEAIAKRLALVFLAEVDARFDHSHRKVQKFWQGVLGDNFSEFTEDVQFLQGFAQGALEMWTQVSPILKESDHADVQVVHSQNTRGPSGVEEASGEEQAEEISIRPL